MYRTRSFVHGSTGFLLALVLALLITPAPVAAQSENTTPINLIDFNTFVKSVSNGQTEVIRGIYVAGIMAFPIVQQPVNDPAYVSPVNNTVTQFALAHRCGSIGLLAHNYLAGRTFSSLTAGQAIRLVHGDSHYSEYVVMKTCRFRALEPQNPNSDFVDLETGEKISAAALFNRMYAMKNHLTLHLV
jgi:hypothetical protein